MEQPFRVFQDFVDVTSLDGKLFPGSCSFVAGEYRLLVLRLLQCFLTARNELQTARQVTNTDLAVVHDAVTCVHLCQSDEDFFHLPAVVRGYAFAAVYHVLNQVGQDRTEGLHEYLVSWAAQLASFQTHLLPQEDLMVRSLLACLSSAPPSHDDSVFLRNRTSELFASENVSPRLESWMMSGKSFDFEEVSDFLEELSFSRSASSCEEWRTLENLNSSEFCDGLVTLIETQSQWYTPVRVVQRLTKVELCAIDDVVPREFLKPLLEWDNAHERCHWAFTRQAHDLWSTSAPVVRNLVLQLPVVAPSRAIALRDLARRAPSRIWATDATYMQLGDLWGCSLLRWLAHESPYAAEVLEASTASDASDCIRWLVWPFPVLRLIKCVLLLDLHPLEVVGTNAVTETVTNRKAALTAISDFADQIEAQLNDLSWTVTHQDCEALCETGLDPITSEKSMATQCDAFVDAFLSHEAQVAELCEEIKQCHRTLGDAESVLSDFLSRIQAVRTEIGDLRTQSAIRAKTLEHSRWIQKVVSEVISFLIVPPDVVQIITAGFHETTEIGTQFRFTLQILVRLLRARHGNVKGAATTPAARSVTLTLATTQAYRETKTVVEDLIVLACLKARTVVEERIQGLKKPRTNIAVQQEHNLGPLQFLIRFMKTALSSLRRAPHTEMQNGENGVTTTPPLFHYFVVKSIFDGVRDSYKSTMREKYFTNICRYISQLEHLMEGSRLAQSSWKGMLSGPQAATRDAIVLPLITDNRHAIAPSIFGLGHKAMVLQKMFEHPLVPISAAAKKSLFSCEECFRSINVLLCDVVTREFLFSFDFFCCDSTLYIEIFQPVIQRLVDYVADSIVQLSPDKHKRQPGSSMKFENKDPIGLLALVIMSERFREQMNRVRQLGCLNGFYDSLLAILWPAFKYAFNRQLESMRTMTPQGMIDLLVGCRTASEMIRVVHPVSMRYAELSSALMLLISCHGDDEKQPNPSQDIDSESHDHFTALRTNLSLMRLEFTRLIVSTTAQLALTNDPVVKAFSSVPMLNNVFHVIGVWENAPKLYSVGSDEHQHDHCKFPDTVELRELLSTSRSQFIEQILQETFPEMMAVARSHADGDQQNLATPLIVSSSKWLDRIKRLVDIVKSCVASPRNQHELIPQLCMQLLLYNTRVHSFFARHSATLDSSTIRNCIVTNQQLLQAVGSAFGVAVESLHSS